MWAQNILLAVIGLSAGVIVASGLFSFVIELGVVSDFADRTHTGEHILLYEDSVALKDSMIAELMTIIRTQAETLLQQQNFINDHFMELHQKKIPPPALARNILIKSILKSSSVFDIL